MKKGFAQIIVVAMVALFIGAFAMFAYQKYFYSNTPFMKKEVEMQDGTLPKPQDKSVNSDNGTANWKTYTNNELGFTFKYDPKATTEFVCYMKDAGGDSILGIKGINYKDGTDCMADITVYAKIIPNNDTLSAATENLKQIQGNWAHIGKVNCKTSNSKLGIEKAILQTCNAPGQRYYVKNPSKDGVINLTIVFSSDAPTTEAVMTFDQILSTFKFTQ